MVDYLFGIADSRCPLYRSLAMIMEEARKKGFISDLHHGKYSNEFLILLDHQPNTRYYISSGMGIWGGKFRIGTQSEYVVLTIEHK